MKRLLISITMVMLFASLFCETRANLGLSAIIPINDSIDVFDPGICPDLSLN